MKRILFGLILFLALEFPTGVRADDTYFLGPQDRVLLRIGRWNPAEQRFEYWDGISGEYTVDPMGNLSISLAGEVPAKGKSTTWVGREVARLLQRKIGLATAPAVSVEIVAYNPIYVDGSVNAPGTYPYRHQLTVQQAIALAGGPPRAQNPVETNEREAIRLRGEIERYRAQISGLEAEQSRLETEIAAYAGDEIAPVQPQTGSGVRLVELENEIMFTNQTSLIEQSRNIKELQLVLRQQITKLDSQIKLRDSQIETTRAELANVLKLRERGLAVTARETALSTALSELETKRIQLEVVKLTAKQQLNLAERDALSLLNTVKQRRLAELKTTLGKITELEIRLQTALTLYNESIARGLVSDQDLDIPQPKYWVTRRLDDRFEASEIGLFDTLLPGDTLQVTIGGTLEINSN